MYRDILVYLGESRQASSALHIAALLARETDSHITGLYVVPYLPLYTLQHTEVLSLEEMTERYEQAVEEKVRKARSDFESSSELTGVISEWRYERGPAAETLCEHGRYADLIVVAQPDENDPPELRAIADTSVLASGRPVLIVPQQKRAFSGFRRVCVAWNGSRESVRALNDALPILQRAEMVTVLSIGKGKLKEDLPGADIALHLARRNVKANAESVEAYNQQAGEEILYRAVEAKADLIVTGGYGHARLREIVLGGVTRFLLRHSTLPLFMSH